MNDREQLVVDLAIQSAAIRFIDDDKERAQKVVDAVTMLQVFVDTDPNTTVLNLSNEAKGLIPDTLTPQEILLANALIDLVVSELADNVVGDVPLNEETVVLVNRYLGKIKEAACVVAQCPVA